MPVVRVPSAVATITLVTSGLLTPDANSRITVTTAECNALVNPYAQAKPSAGTTFRLCPIPNIISSIKCGAVSATPDGAGFINGNPWTAAQMYSLYTEGFDYVSP